jgi:hypothetical protein
MLEFVVRAAIGTLGLAFAVQLGLWAFRLRQPKRLLSAWTAVLIASVAMPAISRLVLASPSGATAVRASGAQEAFAWSDWLTGIYFCVATLLLLRVLRRLALSLRMLRTTQPIAADWASGRKLRTSTWIGAPVTIGSHVLLPAECVNWDARKRRAVLAYQAAHVVRFAFYVQLLSKVNRAVFWFSPLSWWLHRRLMTLAELASDDVVIEALGNRTGYAAILRDVARLPSPSVIGVTMARPATSRQRIGRIMAQAHSYSRSTADEQRESYHEENSRHLVARDIRHRPVVRFHACLGHENERKMLHVV